MAGRAVPELVTLGTTRSGLVISGFPARGADLVPWWHRLRGEHPGSGLWPVLLPRGRHTLWGALDPDHTDDGAADLARLPHLSRAVADAERRTRVAAYGLDGDTDPGPDPDLDSAPVPRRLRGTAARFTASATDGVLALVPAEHGWQVPVVLQWYGGANYDLAPVDHAVVLRDWQERFGAELVTVSDQQEVELLVRRPPTAPEEALAVAREQYDYCPDLVEQGVPTLTRLAEQQVPSGSWYFWWD